MKLSPRCFRMLLIVVTGMTLIACNQKKGSVQQKTTLTFKGKELHPDVAKYSPDAIMFGDDAYSAFSIGSSTSKSLVYILMPENLVGRKIDLTSDDILESTGFFIQFGYDIDEYMSNWDENIYDFYTVDDQKQGTLADMKSGTLEITKTGHLQYQIKLDIITASNEKINLDYSGIFEETVGL